MKPEDAIKTKKRMDNQEILATLVMKTLEEDKNNITQMSNTDLAKKGGWTHVLAMGNWSPSGIRPCYSNSLGVMDTIIPNKIQITYIRHGCSYKQLGGCKCGVNIRHYVHVYMVIKSHDEYQNEKQKHTTLTAQNRITKSQIYSKSIPSIWLLTMLTWYRHGNKMWRGLTSFMSQDHLFVSLVIRYIVLSHIYINTHVVETGNHHVVISNAGHQTLPSLWHSIWREISVVASFSGLSFFDCPIGTL